MNQLQVRSLSVIGALQVPEQFIVSPFHATSQQESRKAFTIQEAWSVLSISRTKRLTKCYQKTISSGRSETALCTVPGHPLQPFDQRLAPLHGLLYPSRLPS